MRIADAYSNSHSYGYRNGYVYTHTKFNGHIHSNRYSNSHIHTYGDSNCYVYPHSDCDRDIYSYRNRDGHVHADSHRNCDVYAHSNCDRYSNCDRTVAALTDATASADTAAAPEPIAF